MKNLKKIFFSLTIMVIFFMLSFMFARAENTESLIVTNLIAAQDYPGYNASKIAQIIDIKDKETPLVWYVSRSSGMVAFIFLWLTIFLGLAIRNPLFKKIIEPIYSFDFHYFMAIMTVFWALIHSASFLLHGVFSLGFADVAIPFFSETTLVNTNYLALGIITFYMIAAMTVTSFLRRYIRHKLWRVLHFLNPAAFIFAVLHGYFIGTDMKNVYFSGIFLISLIMLCLVYVSNMIFLIIEKIKKNN